MAQRKITTRHAASLHPPKNGRIGFKPPYSKREPSQKPRMGSIFYEEGFPPLAMKNVSIKHLQLFEDRSDAACRIVIKTGVSVGGMVRQWAAFRRIAMLGARRGVLERYAARHVATKTAHRSHRSPPASTSSRGRKTACARVEKMVPMPRGHSPAGYSPSWPHPLRYLRGMEAGMPPPRSINQSQ